MSLAWLKQHLTDAPRAEPVDVQTGYAEWAASYPAWAHNPLMEVEEPAMLSLLPRSLAGQRCLDLACGSGRYLRLVQQRQAAQAVGLDLSAAMLAAGRRYTACSTVQGSFQPLPFSTASFDLITCGLAVGHVPVLDSLLAEAARVLKSGGRLLYSDLHPCGTLAGWQRTCTTASGRQLSLAHHLHLYSDHLRACQRAGLHIDAVLEPTLPTVERVPAVLVIAATVRTRTRAGHKTNKNLECQSLL